MRYALRFSMAAPILVASACHAPAPVPAGGRLAVAESLYADLRARRDRIDVSVASGLTGRTDATPFSVYVQAHNTLRQQLSSRLSAVDSAGLHQEDARALGVMRRTLANDLDSLSGPPPDAPTAVPPGCDYDAHAIAAGKNGLDSLRSRIYACYGWAQSHVVVDSDTLDRLSILGALGRTEDAERRRRLFLALDPVWRSVNRNNEPASPYRQLMAAEVRAGGRAEPPAAEQARLSGLPPDSLEHWLLAILGTWRDVRPNTWIEPWDWYYESAAASRKLSPRVPLDRLAPLNREVYRSIGADPGGLNVRYDLGAREGKTPVAYCTFGRRPRLINGRWAAGEPWVFATYRTGGLDNLNELLHETGHAIHISAIRTRSAFADWPDSDPFTEAVAEFVALDVYEPPWQQRWLGDSVSLAEGLAGRYGGIVLDVAWALFEMRMRRDPAADPNQVWTGITRDYLRIRPHPELSWWAMRGQLVDAPGYMMNYAVGAILIADLRARARALGHDPARGDTTWYGWVAPRLYRFGLERPTRQVIEEFLGRPVSPAALLADMRRMKAPVTR